MKSRRLASAMALSLCCVLPAREAGAAGTATNIPAPRDVAYLGPAALTVTATDVAHRVFTVVETLPVRPGPLTLLHPSWIPGAHAPVNGVKRLAGLRITAQGRPLAWTRDVADLQAFHVDVPPGASTIEIRFDHLLPRSPNGDAGVLTTAIANVKWEGLVLYPAGYYASRIDVDAALVLPTEWSAASALRPRATAATSEGRTETRFERVSLETLIDSPVLAGRYVRRIPLDPEGAARPVVLDLVADDPKALEASTEAIDMHRNLVEQLDRLFGARHFAHYDILVSLTKDDLGIGLEHQQSSENGVKSDYFTDWSNTIAARYIIPHEFAHSWNGKFRRPKDLWTPNYNVPMRNSLLWVYEGLTQYWGEVLAARSGMIPLEPMKERFARAAIATQFTPGRGWRPLQDTTDDEIVQGRELPLDWPSWQRSQDYYVEGALIWFDIDTIIRERSNNRRSLDDFARAFFGVDDGRTTPLLYDFDDVVNALQRIQPDDWKTYLRTRLDELRPVPNDGFERAGWRLGWTDQESDYAKSNASRLGGGFAYSLGFDVNKSNEIVNVAWDGPAFRAGVSGGTLLAVNLRAYEPDVLKAAIAAAKDTTTPIELLIKDGNDYQLAKIDYHDGLRYPTLERIDGRPDLLTPILSPR